MKLLTLAKQHYIATGLIPLDIAARLMEQGVNMERLEQRFARYS